MTLTLTELIHPSAVIDPEAEIAPDVQVGPYAIIEGPVQVGPGLRHRGARLPQRAADDGPRQLRRPRRGAGQEPAAQGLSRRADLAADRRRQRLPRARHRPPGDRRRGAARPGSATATCS